MYEIVIGRSPAETEKHGLTGTFLLGKHYVTMGQTESLSNEVRMDVAKSHVVSVFGKRGSGKSYTMGDIAEGMMSLPSEITRNLSVIMLDTMGIYWTMKFPNNRDQELLAEWNMKPEGMNVVIYTPKGFYKSYREKGIPTDHPFSIKPNDLDASDWTSIFRVESTHPVGVLIQKVIGILKAKSPDFSLQDVVMAIQAEPNASKDAKDAAGNLFRLAESWELFDVSGTHISELASAGQITILDVSCYATSQSSTELRALVIGLVSQKLFNERMVLRKSEEYRQIHEEINYLSEEDSEQEKEMPLTWLIIDEAHEFLPVEGSTLATKPLITILREGRQPGVSLVLASQQPGKIHTDVLTQSDIVIAHRITAKIDIDALGLLMQSYLRAGLDKLINELPRVTGAALVFDDTNERIYPIQVRPRITWHGGSAPSPVYQKKTLFEF